MDIREELLYELFRSPKRKLIDTELLRVIHAYAKNTTLLNNILYHFCLDIDVLQPALDHSKRLRSYLCLLFAEEQGHDILKALPFAVTIELIHNATLIVDDVQDEDFYRCGRSALWKKTGIADAINVAFFLSCIAPVYFQIKRNELHLPGIYDDFIINLGNLVSGQQIDLSSNRSSNLNLATYETMVKGKTGALLYLSCLGGSSISGALDTHHKDLIRKFAQTLALCHQVNDDIDDILASHEEKQFVVPQKNIARFITSFHQTDRYFYKDDLRNIFKFVEEYLSNLSTKLSAILSELHCRGLVQTDLLNRLVEILLLRNSQKLEEIRL